MLDFRLINQSEQSKFNFFRIFEDRDDIIKLTSDKKCVYLKDQPNITFHGEFIFYKDSQSVVCDTILNGVVEAALEGISCLILAYGAGQSGKSKTCFGSHGCRDDRGVSYCLLEQLFEAKQKMEDTNELVIELGFLEFTLTNTIDLLLYKKYGNQKHSYFTLIETISEGKGLLYFGEKMRQSLKIENRKSHRYSAILAIRLTCKSLTKSNPIIRKATIQIADLAALELCCHKNNSIDYNYSKHTKDKFVGNITMMQILHLLNKRRKQKICIFKSPIVRYLSATLTARSITKFIGHSVARLDKLKSVIRVANQFAMQKFTEVHNDIEVDKSLYIEKLQTEIKQLKSEMALSDYTRNEAICPKPQKQIQLMIEDFLKNDAINVDVHFTQINECFKIFKELFVELKEKNDKLQLELAVLQSKDDIANTSVLSTIDDSSIRSGNNDKTIHGGNSFKQSDNSFGISGSMERVGQLAMGEISIGPAQTQTILNNRVNMKKRQSRKQQASVFHRRLVQQSEDPAKDEVTGNIIALVSKESLNNTINKLQKNYLSTCTLLQQAHSHIDTLKNLVGVGIAHSGTDIRATLINKHLYVIEELEQKVSDLRQAILDIQQYLDQALESNHQNVSCDTIKSNTGAPFGREDR